MYKLGLACMIQLRVCILKNHIMLLWVKFSTWYKNESRQIRNEFPHRIQEQWESFREFENRILQVSNNLLSFYNDIIVKINKLSLHDTIIHI